MRSLNRFHDNSKFKEKLIRAFCGVIMIVFTFFASTIFVACGDKYADLGFVFYSSSGEVVEELEFMMDSSKETQTQKIGVELTGIEKEDVGQLVIYSSPRELVVVTNYYYKDNMCYVDLTPQMPTANTADAKLIVSHLASGKKGEISLKIDQKSEGVQILSSKYIVSIPESGEIEHIFNFTEVATLIPVGSTDKVYFKIAAGSSCPDGVTPIKVENAGVEDVCSGFKLDASVKDSTHADCVKIYIVTQMEGYPTEKYDLVSQQISIYFKHIVDSDSLKLKPKDVTMSVDLEESKQIQLVANDLYVNTFTLTLNYANELLFETEREDELNFFDLYEVEVQSSDTIKISAFVDGNNDVVVLANIYTEDYVPVKIALKPINYVGDIKRVETIIFVKGEMRSDEIKVSKNGEFISTENSINIFDYYEDGSSLGALFKFVPNTFSGLDVHYDLNKMRIVVAPEILCEQNCFRDKPASLNTKLYSLMIHVFNDYLEFNFDADLGAMVSEEISASDEIYIKYVKGAGSVESANFGLKVLTTNNSPLDNWKDLTSSEVSLDFNRLEGVMSMVLEAGEIDPITLVTYTAFPQGNPEYIYLDRLESIDKGDPYIYVAARNDSVLSVDGSPISEVDFTVKVEALEAGENPLKISHWSALAGFDPHDHAVTSLPHQHKNNIDSDAVVLVFDNNTDIGDYKVTFYQEGIIRSSVICRVYEDLTDSSDVQIDFETNNSAFANIEHKTEYADADYIVASGQKLSISIKLPQAVLDSQIVNTYQFNYEVGIKDAGGFTSVASKEEYFEKVHDDSTFNHALLNFIKGTHISGTPQYVYLTISVKTKTFDNVITVGVDENVHNYYVCFYIYEKIKTEDISISSTSMTRYFEQYLGVYYKDMASATLNIQMVEELWNYANTLPDGTKVEWKLDDESGILDKKIDDKNYSLTFGNIMGKSSYVRILKAYVYQFENIFELQCVFNVEKPILTERISIQSELKVKGDIDLTYYINLKKGQTYQFLANNYSSQGEVTHPETIIQVFDESGSAFSSNDYFYVNQSLNTITVKQVTALHEFKVVVFAKDALMYIPSQDKSGYNQPSSFLMQFAGAEKGMCDKAYFVIEIILSDGTEHNPYLITNPNEFWEIDDTELYKKAYYKLMTSMNLKSSTDTNGKTIKDFSGTIITDNNNIYTIDGIDLDYVNQHLFSGFEGSISNIRFIVNFDYNFTILNQVEKNLGLFDKNNGTLLDVGIEVSGTANFTTRSTTYYFGALVGENLADIKYTQTSGTMGSIELSGSSKVYFGGLVGKNVGNIIGCEQPGNVGENKIIINTALGRDKTLSSIVITSHLAENSSIGGVVGFNTFDLGSAKRGVVHNAFVEAEIDAESTSNVGGVIGTNTQQQLALMIYGNGYIASVEDVLLTENIGGVVVRKFIDIAIYNVKSASTIIAKNNVGGLVGTDSNGLYIDCDFQILSASTKIAVIQGNKSVGGIAGKSTYGKFAYCSVMSYWWNYAGLKTDISTIVVDEPDIVGFENVGGIVGNAVSSNKTFSITLAGYAVQDKTIIAYSSVNAYIKITKEESSSVGGLLTTESRNYISIVANAFFIGMLDCEKGIEYSSRNLCLDNNDSSYYNYVYTLNLDDASGTLELIKGNWGSNNIFTIDANPGNELHYWWHNIDINGGYAFITLDQNPDSDSSPIFDLAPDSILTSVRNETNDKLKKVLRLEYYDFSQNTSLTDEQISRLDQNHNKQKYVYKTNALGTNIGEIDIETKPTNIGSVVINVRSTNTNVLDVALDGRLLINGVGECELIFSSVLNPNAGEVEDRTIKVIVDYPIGDTFNVGTSKTDKNKIVDPSETENIGKGSSRLYYALTGGSIEYDFNLDYEMENYFYQTKENLYLQVKVKYLTDTEDFKLDEIISISGQVGTLSYDAVYKYRILTVDIDDKTPFSISILKKLDNLVGKNYSLEIEIIPYTYVNNGYEDIKSFYYVTETEVKSSLFKLSTLEGTTSATFSYDEAIVYPNDTVYISAYLKTDLPVCMVADGSIDVAELQKLIYKNPINFGNVRFNVGRKLFRLEQGGIYSADGALSYPSMPQYETRVRTVGYEYLSAGEYVISNSSGHEIVVFAYELENGVYKYDPISTQYNWQNSTYNFTLSADRYVKFAFRNGADTELVTTEVQDVILQQYNVYVDRSSYDPSIQVQTIVFRIEFYDMDLKDEKLLNMTLESTTYDYILDEVNYTIIPQRINKIEIKNYYYKNIGTVDVPEYEQVLDDILKPNFPGKMQIDIVPNNGYFDYLEISDITGNEEILFIQVDKDGNALTLQHDPSSDGKGIKLYAEVGETIYVRTQINKNYSSKIHSVELRAYSSQGKLLYRQPPKEVDVKMLPEINMEYVVPDGSTFATINSSEGGERTDLLLANGVDANFKVTTYNSSGDLDISLSGDMASKYEFVQDIGMHYILKRKEDVRIDEADIGKKVGIEIKTYAYFDNGDFEVATCFVEFEIVEFVIHSVSVNSSIDNSDQKEIYGFFGKAVNLKFYFDKDDISFYDPTTTNEPYWDTEYHYGDDAEVYIENEQLKQIYDILDKLNSYDGEGKNKYLILNHNTYNGATPPQYEPILNQGKVIGVPGRVQKVELYQNSLQAVEGYDKKTIIQDGEVKKIDDPKYLAAAFMMKYNKSARLWDIYEYATTPLADDLYYTIDKNFKLNFRDATKWYEPEVVSTAQEFKEMQSGGRYILKNSIVLEDYIPLDVNLVEFDGNGFEVIIHSFGLFKDEDIQAGLFRQVYPNMIVKNTIVKYKSINDNGNYSFGNVNGDLITYKDLCNNPEVSYSSINFGGIAAINNGIITNCSVKGLIAINASTIEKKKFASGDSYAINFYAGGLVSENAETGYITNSTSALSIYALANIGGFVYSNDGKIASSSVEDGATIYGYNNSLEKTIVVKISAFVVENENLISMSGVDLTSSTVSAKDTSAGFVYSNTGVVEDSYVFMATTGTNNNTFNGFVARNSGFISRAYTCINNGSKVDSNDTMFAPVGTEGLKNCIEFVVQKAGYTSGVKEGLSSVDSGYRYYQPTYEAEGFAFGDNKNAVWQTVSGKTPRLTAVMEKVRIPDGDLNGLLPISVQREIVDGIEVTTYDINFASYGTKENPYIIHDMEDSKDITSSWTNFLINDHNKTKSYYRLVKDLDFINLGDNPASSTISFMGNLQGNNMTISNIMLYSSSSLDSLGLFKELKNANDSDISNAVRNLKLTTTSVWATQTSSVGLLAGIVEDFNVYNISIDSEGVILVGGNAVGGLAGIARGEFDIDQISSNVGVNSTRASSVYNYAIYNAKNNKKAVSANIKDVYYAGSVVGILDGYSRTTYDINDNINRTLDAKYYHVRNIYVNGDIMLLGDSVGAAFGFVGERVYVDRVCVDIGGMLKGTQYSAGIAGENRGIIDNHNLKTILEDGVFDESANVSSGIVGLNLGGLVRNVEVNAKIKMTGYGKIVGGIVGRNIHGTINSAHFDGEIDAYYAGGIVGVNYNGQVLANASYGAGTLTAECKTNNKYLIPKVDVNYIEEGRLISRFGNVSLSRKTFEYMASVLRQFYGYSKKEDTDNPTLNALTVKYKVFGMVVGLSYDEGIVGIVGATTEIDPVTGLPIIDHRYNVILNDEAIIFNKEGEVESSLVYKDDEDDLKDVVLEKGTDSKPDITVTFENPINVLNINPDGDNYIMYLVGARSTALDSWTTSYSDQFILVKLAL